MPDLTPVFEITRSSNGLWADILWRLGVGIAALVMGAMGLFRQWRQRASWSSWLAPIALTGWACLWLVMHQFPTWLGHVDSLVDAYRKADYEIVEGDVVVLHRQPATGHTKGDIIRVGDATFEINFFLATPAYHDTIAHGGALKDGVHARIYHRDGAILRVDVAKP